MQLHTCLCNSTVYSVNKKPSRRRSLQKLHGLTQIRTNRRHRKCANTAQSVHSSFIPPTPQQSTPPSRYRPSNGPRLATQSSLHTAIINTTVTLLPLQWSVTLHSVHPAHCQAQAGEVDMIPHPLHCKPGGWFNPTPAPL